MFIVLIQHVLPVIVIMAVWQPVHLSISYMDVSKCTTCHKAIMLMAEREYCAKAILIYYARPYLPGFEHSVCAS